MRFHVVDKIVFYPHGCPLSGFHHDLFHGLGSRFSNFLKRRPEDVTMAQQKELSLLLNLHHTPSIIEPITHMLVQDHVKEVIGVPPGCMWKPVKVERVCNIPYAKGVRFDPGEWSRKEEPEEVMMEHSFPVNEAEVVPQFHELFCPHLEDVHKGFHALRNIRFSIPRNQEKSRVKINGDVLSAFPIVWHDGYHVFNDEMFQKCEPFFDWDYFEHVVGELPR